MRWDEIPPDVAKQAVEAKVQARRNNSKRNIAMLIGFLFAIGFALWWYLYSPISSLSPKINFLVGVGIGLGIALPIVAASEGYVTEEAKCPVCGFSWKIRDGKGVPIAERMECWDRCPGCGLLMSDALLNVTLKRHASTNSGQTSA